MKDDKQLQHDVIAELRWEPAVASSHIGVAAKSGVVTLSGHVDNFWSKWQAENAAARVEGVTAVAQEIYVQLPVDHKRSDQDIAGAVVERMRWNASIPNGGVKVTVSKGVVTLVGELDWHYQKDIAETEVRNLRGVMDVVNRIVLKERVNTADVSEAIHTALKRSWYTRPDSILVKADEGKVTLSGVVHSPHARAMAGEIAWNAPGATDVINRLTVN